MENHGWLERVTHSAFLGTPHHGSPLEKVGNLANALLSATPYTLPLMRLGNIRSRGIKDLRHGALLDEDWLGRDPDALVLLQSSIDPNHEVDKPGAPAVH